MDTLDYVGMLQNQLNVLQEDKRKTNEKMFQILGGIKVVEFLINEANHGNIPTGEEVKTNGA